MAGAPSATVAPQGGGTAQAPAAAGASTPAAAVGGAFPARFAVRASTSSTPRPSLTLTTATQDLGPIDVKAYDYMRSILVTLTTTR